MAVWMRGLRRGVASLRIGEDGSRVRLDAERLRWAKLRDGTIKACFDGILIAIG
jgi:hypothetical protein